MGFYKNGKLEGEYKRYLRSGSLIDINNYKNGVLQNTRKATVQ